MQMLLYIQPKKNKIIYINNIQYMSMPNVTFKLQKLESVEQQEQQQ